MTATIIPFPPTPEQAADRIMDAMLNNDDGIYSIPEKELQTLLDTAGKTLAKHFVFAYCYLDEYMGEGWIITPKKIWDEEGFVHDRPSPIGHILPPHGEDINDCGTWIFPDTGKGPLAFARALQYIGFQWDRDFQTFIDCESREALHLTKALHELDETNPFGKPNGP